MSDAHTIYGPMSLGALIDALKLMPQDHEVMFDVLGLAPTTFASYRGYYDHLALGYKDEHRIKASELIELAEAAIGEVFTGYKGGDYVMDRGTPVWVDNYGHSWGFGVDSVEGGGEHDWRVVLHIKHYD